MVYLPVDVPYFAVEPVTNANDGFNLEAAGKQGTGVFLVQPGETRSSSFTLGGSGARVRGGGAPVAPWPKMVGAPTARASVVQW